MLGNANQLLAASCNQYAERAIGKAPNTVQVMASYKELYYGQRHPDMLAPEALPSLDPTQLS